tara:strand:- start:328 stop:954 length:627 start_codon:yes stop_codon:yes gene_type:complete
MVCIKNPEMIVDSHIIHTNRTLELGSFLVRNRFRNNHKSFKEVVAEIKGLFETVPKSNYNTWDSEIQGITGAFRLGRECIICGDSDKRNHYQIVINYKYGVTGYCCHDCVEYDQDPEDLCISTEKRVIKIMKYLTNRRYQPELLYDSDEETSDSEDESDSETSDSEDESSSESESDGETSDLDSEDESDSESGTSDDESSSESSDDED